MLCCAGAALASYLLSPINTVSVGASGAIFGLFVVSVLTRLQFNLRSLLVCMCVLVCVCVCVCVRACVRACLRACLWSLSSHAYSST